MLGTGTLTMSNSADNADLQHRREQVHGHARPTGNLRVQVKAVPGHGRKLTRARTYKSCAAR